MQYLTKIEGRKGINEKEHTQMNYASGLRLKLGEWIMCQGNYCPWKRVLIELPNV